MVKNTPANAGDSGSIPGSGSFLGKGKDHSLHFLPGKFHGWRSLAVYVPQRCKESDVI